jgi:hypothetical protein
MCSSSFVFREKSDFSVSISAVAFLYFMYKAVIVDEIQRLFYYRYRGGLYIPNFIFINTKIC